MVVRIVNKSNNVELQNEILRAVKRINAERNAARRRRAAIRREERRIISKMEELAAWCEG